MLPHAKRKYSQQALETYVRGLERKPKSQLIHIQSDDQAALKTFASDQMISKLTWGAKSKS